MKNIFLLSLFIMGVFFVTGCVNVNQKGKLQKDGSGSIDLHYWTKMKNVKNKQELGGFSFDEGKIKSKYSSSNNDVKDVKIEDKLDDSTKHVNVSIEFDDLNKLSSASGFAKVTPTWKEGKEGSEFEYIIKQDTSAAKTMNASKYELVYEFEFPDEVLKTNGIKDGKKVKWERSLKDLKEDLVLTATVKSDGEGTGSSEKNGKKCGLFGIELPLIFALGMAGIRSVSKRKKK